MCKYKEILKLLNSQTILHEVMKDFMVPIQFTYNECLKVLEDPNLNVDECHLFKINVVIDYLHDRLNTGHWSQVPNFYRYAFTAATFIKSVFILKLKSDNEESLKESLKCIDLGILLGAPLPENSELLTKIASILSQALNMSTPNLEETPFYENKNKRKLSCIEYNEYNQISGQEIRNIFCPTLELFYKKYFDPQVPVKLQGCISHWPAMQKWLDINYLLSIAGNRIVPIEIGSNYADENWSQKLMTLKDFIKCHFLSETNKLGYLAQHNLFDQIPDLRNDISIPEYCCLSKNFETSTEPEINVWFGPKNTVSPLHYDPKNNFLTQIFGTKQIILYSPKDSEYLYPHENTLLKNTAQVNPLECDLQKYPLFKNASMYKCILNPGEMLFIPEKWWHHVTALDKSFSVSFWWQ